MCLQQNVQRKNNINTKKTCKVWSSIKSEVVSIPSANKCSLCLVSLQLYFHNGTSVINTKTTQNT